METLARPHHDSFQLIISKKRSRSPASSAIDSSRKLGHPTHIEVTARDPLQAQLQASQSSIVSTASGPPSIQSARSSNVMASQEYQKNSRCLTLESFNSTAANQTINLHSLFSILLYWQNTFFLLSRSQNSTTTTNLSTALSLTH